MRSKTNREGLRGLTWVWTRGGLSWSELGRRVWSEVQTDDVFGRSAQLSYYLILALFPFLILLSAVLGFIFKGNTDLYSGLLSQARPVVPPAAYQLIRATAEQITTGAGGGLLSFGVLGTLWAASSGMQAIIDGLNVAYDVREFRPWWKRRLVAIILTVVLMALSIAAFIGALWGSRLVRWVAGEAGLTGAFNLLYPLAEFVVPLVFMMAVFVLIHQFAPNVRGYPWQAQLPGAVAGVLFWLASTWAFRLYLSFSNSYNRTYGSLGAVIVLLLWLYLTGIAMLVGGEINAEIRQAAAQAGAPEAKRPIEDKQDATS